MNYCKCANYITFFIINVINLICGFLIMVLNSIIINEGERFKIVFNLKSNILAVFNLIGSLIMFSLGIYGLYLTFHQGRHKKQLISYSVVSVCLGIAEIGISAKIFTLREDGIPGLKEHFTAKVGEYDSEIDVTERYVNYIHRELHCCGLDSYQDWVSKYNKTRPPESCCKSGKGCDTTVVENINREGCMNVYIEHYRAKGLHVALAIIIFAALHFFSGLVGGILAYRQKNYEQRQTMDLSDTPQRIIETRKVMMAKLDNFTETSPGFTCYTN